MKYTSAQANKLLKQLNEEKNLIKLEEKKSAKFIAATVEKLEDVRPEYDYEATSGKIREYDRKIRVVKHAINQFNVTTVVEEYGMTIDEMLVYLPQLGEQLDTLAKMVSTPAKERRESYTSNLIEYEYANYDVKKAADDYRKLFAMKAGIQTALDAVNSNVTFEIEL